MKEADLLEKAQRETIIYMQKILEDQLRTTEGRIYYLQYVAEHIEYGLKLLHELKERENGA